VFDALRRSGKAGGGIPLSCFMIVMNQLFSLAKNKVAEGIALAIAGDGKRGCPASFQRNSEIWRVGLG
jgi:hypothetical protein